MRRILSFLTAVSFLLVANTSVVMAFSMQWETQKMHHDSGMSRQHILEEQESQSDDCCDNVQPAPMDCDATNHECCYAPFPATSTVSYYSSSDQKSSYYLVSCQNPFDTFLQDKLTIRVGNQSHAPPWYGDTLKLETTYTALVWQVRNNN